MFAFTDGLQLWARLELERRGIKDLNMAISVASLIKIRRPEKPKLYNDRSGEGRSGGDRTHRGESSPRFSRPKEGGHHGNRLERGRETQRIKCYFCEGPHLARECPKRGKLSALDKEEQPVRESESSKMGSLQFLIAANAKLGVPKTEDVGRLFVEVKVDSNTVNALLDTGANHNFLEANEADRIGIKYVKERGWLMAVNLSPNATCGVYIAS
ncbi:hypothetical protein MLD38_010665 [Melastoma candidum]|uniref:Uncharacterized protein n=1 Tax=Melastoma candidum TaxID=119954 RepID=A0ACB9R0K8_9MYRT|nr:hypothetical protein MLD38_010665 [Melastoma candidum]